MRDRIAPLGRRREGVELEEVEALDRLRLAVLENLEVFGFQPLDDLPVDGGIGVDAYEVRPAAENRSLLRLRGRRRLLSRRNGPRAALRHKGHKDHKDHED